MAQARDREHAGTIPGPRQDDRPPAPERQDSPDAGHLDGGSALAWSLTAMSDALARLAAATAADAPQALAAATEAVWWITAVDAAMTRHHPRAYDRALATLDPAARKATQRSLIGLRYVRSQLGTHADPADFVQPQPTSSGRPLALAWTWQPLSPSRPQRTTAREPSPYREYRAQLAGRPLAEALSQAAGFLSQAHATALGAQENDHRAPHGAGLPLPG